MSQNHLLLISHDVVGRQMAGPGIRYYHLARVLHQEFAVTLAVPDKGPPNLDDTPFRVTQYLQPQWPSIEPLVKTAQVILCPSDIASDFPQLAASNAALIIDGYDPLLSEWLPLHQHLPREEQQARWSIRMAALNEQYLRGDFFICASERQRDWWLGLLEANGRVNPHTYATDSTLRRLVDVVPFGLPEAAPQHTAQVLKGVWPGVGEADRVILWGGGLWPWLDPLTAIRAVGEACRVRPDLRLLFPGTRHPNPRLAEIPTHNQNALQLAQELGLLDRAVFFGDWMPYEQWPNVLLESDLALTLHYDTLESRLAFRSRMLEYIWAGVPIIATQGDATSDLVAAYGLGELVAYEDVAGVAAAMLRLLETPRATFAARFEAARRALTWEQAARPLIEFCRRPRRAPDKVALGSELGAPYYRQQVAHREASCQREYQNEIARLQSLVQGYEQGRFMRLMRYLHRLKRSLLGRLANGVKGRYNLE